MAWPGPDAASFVELRQFTGNGIDGIRINAAAILACRFADGVQELAIGAEVHERRATDSRGDFRLGELAGLDIELTAIDAFAAILRGIRADINPVTLRIGGRDGRDVTEQCRQRGEKQPTSHSQHDASVEKFSDRFCQSRDLGRS